MNVLLVLIMQTHASVLDRFGDAQNSIDKLSGRYLMCSRDSISKMVDNLVFGMFERVFKPSSLHADSHKMTHGQSRSQTETGSNPLTTRLPCRSCRRQYSKLRRHKECAGISNFDRDLIIEPSGTHTHTVILLHGLYCGGDDFASLPEKLQDLFGEKCDAAKGIKYIFPNAPVRTISWPGEEEEGVPSWYNYFTDKGGELEDDEINITHLHEETKRIHRLIDQEVEELGDPRKIILGGNSQGGTVACNAALTCEHILGALIILRSNLLALTKVDMAWNSLPVFIFRAELDTVFCHELTARRFKQFVDNKFFVIEWMEKDLRHTDDSVCELLHSARWIGKCFFGVDARIDVQDRPDGPSPDSDYDYEG